ncbi:hypothetical protein KM043_001030 [Ampulex compressa]|nr:hypothetical protein KM043_001030 [Ampulex compressa]
MSVNILGLLYSRSWLELSHSNPYYTAAYLPHSSSYSKLSAPPTILSLFYSNSYQESLQLSPSSQCSRAIDSDNLESPKSASRMIHQRSRVVEVVRGRAGTSWSGSRSFVQRGGEECALAGQEERWAGVKNGLVIGYSAPPGAASRGAVREEGARCSWIA